MGPELGSKAHQSQPTWITRNKARHGKDPDKKAQRKLEKAHRRIRDHRPQAKCSLQAQRHYYYPTVEDHFRRDTDASSLENWLETYEPMIMQNIRHQRTNSDHTAYAQLTKSFIS